MRAAARHLTTFAGNNEWYTPVEIIERARAVLGEIDVDPASNDFAQRAIKARTYYTRDNSRLEKEWFGNVWMNPPYSRGLIGLFVRKLIHEHKSGRVVQAICLTNSATDTRWFNSLLVESNAVCFTRGRLQFVSATGHPLKTPPLGQAFAYFGMNEQAFIKAFSEIGNVVMCWQRTHPAAANDNVPASISLAA
jgi:ParB family chromosome partitioning protein